MSMLKVIKTVFIAAIFLSQVFLFNARASEEQAVKDVLNNYINYVNAGNLEELFKLYTDDAVVMPPFDRSRSGREQIEKSVRETHEKITFNLTLQIDEVIVSGDWAFARAQSFGAMALKETGDSIIDEGKVLFILHKDPGGWKIARYMLNPSTPLPGA